MADDIKAEIAAAMAIFEANAALFQVGDVVEFTRTFVSIRTGETEIKAGTRGVIDEIFDAGSIGVKYNGCNGSPLWVNPASIKKVQPS